MRQVLRSLVLLTGIVGPTPALAEAPATPATPSTGLPWQHPNGSFAGVDGPRRATGYTRGDGLSRTPFLQNRPPTVRARCEPCTVYVGKTSIVSVETQDPDGDALTHAWSAPAGSLTSASGRQTPWTAPMVEGPVPVTVRVDDGKGASASDVVTIQVIKEAAKEIVFEDVHFDFDRYSLRPEGTRALDEAIRVLQEHRGLRITIEGHTCTIGTAEYNLALGERRSNAVREYLSSRGVGADRLQTLSYGEERPKFDNVREETRRLNRRAALVVRVQ